MKPVNKLVNPMLTDLYQLTMAYAYWKAGRHNDHAVFDLFFRKCPFGGEFAIFAGLQEAIKFVCDFQFTTKDIKYLKSIMPDCDPEFFTWLRGQDCSKLTIRAVPEGTVVFPREPLIQVEGPLAVCQLLETTLLNLVNFATLMATNAVRFRLAAGDEATLLEFGLRRAQGPDGAISAAKYAVMGGFNGTSNVLAGQLFDLQVKGTHAHAFVQSFIDLTDLKSQEIETALGKTANFVQIIKDFQKELDYNNTNPGELAAFIAYAQAFPKGFLALVDTYDTLESGLKNFLLVALALNECGYKPVGIRLDSGDLAYLSKKCREYFNFIAEKYRLHHFSKLVIAASNDITVENIRSMQLQGHEINTFGVGTHLVTCKEQPALGGVYKLVEVHGRPRIKLSQEAGKITLPGKKTTYRLFAFDKDEKRSGEHAVIDLIALSNEPAPQAGREILCLHPFETHKKIIVCPERVETLNTTVWQNGKLTDTAYQIMELTPGQIYMQVICRGLQMQRSDHLRPANPTPYKVAVSQMLYNFLHELWAKETPNTENK